MKKLLILGVLALSFSLTAGDRPATRGEWVFLQSGPGLRISIESYKARQGWTPVTVSIGGTELRLTMDGQGRVVHEWAKGLATRGQTLFTIALDAGRVTIGREAHPIRVYERNGARTRLMFVESEIALPLRLDEGGRSGKLYLGGLEIPASVGRAGTAGVPESLADRRAFVMERSVSRQGPGASALLSPGRIRSCGR